MGGKSMYYGLLDRQLIKSMLKENNQNPKIVRSNAFKRNTDTLIETDSKGIYYILEYNANTRVGWSISFSRLMYLQMSHMPFAIIFLDSKNSKIYIVLDYDKAFYSQNFDKEGNSYRVERKHVLKNEISQESLDYYFGE